MNMARKKKNKTFCAAICAVISAFVLIFTNVTSTKNLFTEHLKAHNGVVMEHEHNETHSFAGFHDHEQEDFYTHTHTDADGTTSSHRHHHDHCTTKLTSQVVACLPIVDVELVASSSSFLLNSWMICAPILSTHFREPLRPPILA
jgi:hypothetical protein